MVAMDSIKDLVMIPMDWVLNGVLGNFSKGIFSDFAHGQHQVCIAISI